MRYSFAWTFFLSVLLVIGCDDGSDGTNDAGGEDGALIETAWTISLDTSVVAEPLSPALLGQYDLSGALFLYDQVPGLVEAMQSAGFSEWRLGVGRWEAATLMLPTLSDGTPCAPMGSDSMAPAGTTDLDLIAARDWFTDNGQPVTALDTLDDDRYDLGYVRSVLDVAEAFGAEPFLNLDLMPRALAKNRDPLRVEASSPDACLWSFMNQVSNTGPADNSIFASAVEGLISRLVEGSHGEAGRALTYVELWNEPEFCYFWDPLLENATACPHDDVGERLTAYFEWAVLGLLRLQAYRQANPVAAELKFGLGSFAQADVAAAAVAALDEAGISMDFVSFHAYSNDPMDVVEKIRLVAVAVESAPHFANAEIALTEWGPDLENLPDPHLMDQALHAMTVLVLGAAMGLDHAHRAIFYAFYDGIPFGMVENDVSPRPILRAYEMLSQVIREGARRLPPAGFENGELEFGQGVVLAARQADGSVRVLIVNRADAERTVDFELDGNPVLPSTLKIFSDPALGIVESSPDKLELTLPAQAIVLVEL